MELFIYKRAQVITVISERFRQRLLAKGVADKKLRVIPNFVDTDFMQPGNRQNPFSEAHELNDKFVVLYAGNIGLTQGVETIISAARQLQDVVNLQFVIVGDGTRRSWLEEELAADSLPNVLLLPYQPRSMVPFIYATADLCLVPLKKGTAQETFPSKIYTIMAAARPVVATADPDSELAWLVGEAACGWAAPPDDVAAMVAAIREASNQREVACQRGEMGRAYVVDHHSRQAVTGQYDALIREFAV
jgi:colanic acid biosynthesis glycosyl transferase WcaI